MNGYSWFVMKHQNNAYVRDSRDYVLVLLELLTYVLCTELRSITQYDARCERECNKVMTVIQEERFNDS